jgi:pyrroloquinoline quinone (PQQ) biosynthesis protein C
MGIDGQSKPGIEVEIWREGFLSLVQNSSMPAAVGAIGLGTESVVKYIYRDIIQALERYTNLSLEQYVFFPLHTEVDDEHGLILLNIAEQIASESPEAERELRKGMLRALNLRASFWDDMYKRALVLSNATVTL